MTVKPSPFKRPEVKVRDERPRVWAHREAGKLQEGDIVANRGIVRAIVFEGLSVSLTCGDETKPFKLNSDSPIYAFVLKD